MAAPVVIESKITLREASKIHPPQKFTPAPSHLYAASKSPFLKIEELKKSTMASLTAPKPDVA